MLIVELYVDCRDAMGANAVNTMAEAVAPLVESIAGRDRLVHLAPALLAAALCARGRSVIMNANQVDRGYEAIDTRLRRLGAAHLDADARAPPQLHLAVSARRPLDREPRPRTRARRLATLSFPARSTRVVSAGSISLSNLARASRHIRWLSSAYFPSFLTLSSHLRLTSEQRA